MNLTASNLRYWLVDHPTISQFEWRQGHTFGASPTFLALTVLAYLTLTLALHRASHLLTLGPTLLRSISTVHNIVLILLSFIMAVGCSLSALSQMPNPRWIFCFPNPTTPAGPTFFWAHVFYLSKILEFVDTFLIILGNSKRRLSFLHVYHHTVVVVMCYMWLSTSQSLFPLGIITNATVHTLMYAYYLLCALGRRPWWTRLVTEFQIVQFGFGFAVSGPMLYYHFAGSGCSGLLGWCFTAVFNASLLALFVDFRSNKYNNAPKNKQP